MNDQIDQWCQAICQRTGTSSKFFINDLRRLAPVTKDEADAIMGILLYTAWHDAYDLMWDTTRATEDIAID